MTIAMEPEALRRGLADIAAAAEALAAARARSAQRVDDLLAGWRGEAAESFAAAYDAWAAAAGDVGAELEALRVGVTGARTALTETDDVTATGVSHLAGRLG